MPMLEVTNEDGAVHRFELGKEPITIGRHSDNQVKVDDHRLSRFHCEVKPVENGYQVKDLGSRNGTRINNQMISKVTLKPGQTFTAGRTRFRVIPSPLTQDNHQTKPQKPARFPGGLGNKAAGLSPQAVALGEEHLENASAPAMAAAPVATRRASGTLGSIQALTKIGKPLTYPESRISLVNARGQTVHAADLSEKDENAGTALHLLRLLIYGCARTGASDIHVEPKAGSALVRLRIDGTMINITHLDDQATMQMISLVKVLCDIDISKRSVMQEGHLAAELPDRRIDFRISFTPSRFGQKLVARVLDPHRCPSGLDDVFLPDQEHNAIRRAIARESGMLIICGPTGSGKTTTLYAALRELDANVRNIVTIEDPVEYELPGLTQIPVNVEKDHTFSKLLRSTLRQDPDVMVVGEVRDADTAVTAMQAGNTGHLVLSTIHSQGSISTIIRLLDLGVEPYMVASTLTLVLAQRLVRTLCPRCRREVAMSDQDRLRLGQHAANAHRRWEAVGCKACYGTGYQGRRAIFELMPLTDVVKDAILGRVSMTGLKEAALAGGLRPMTENGAELVVAGITSLEEVDRVTGEG
ncbi:ATPase, T2SS/T4P/T4SS family [Mucisphaera sp.]|uniref:ATPase, T2SS/T4P/T4SS family n=1 Tax=Mucisphaera sp. TaxID=2913024 RepID=UPI003D09B742